eukprot:CAMPEP_0206043060 /NCGR_PEP_ID=MMETSP1466-20131121/7560_1 /ASSEMBLY_ACC=CAM_ASM_001126 /TAXON_ID=44452 /ORGANISM="Pavlova gyrans, Strain CCMP608" /LENGTH=119 /DNA_ID=CAMNT_0053417815 /DNA_START=31 /DNA_END=390 /DNA_ORIENTATION=+
MTTLVSYGRLPSCAEPKQPRTFAELMVSKFDVVVFSSTECSYCTHTKQLLRDVGFRNVTYVELDTLEDEEEVHDDVLRITGQRTLPNIFIRGKHIGGHDDLERMLESTSHAARDEEQTR